LFRFKEPAMHPLKQRLKHWVVGAACFAAAFVASSFVVLAVGVAFHVASREPWLAESPQSRAVAQRCFADGERADRYRCVRAAVAAALARDAGAAQVAALGARGASASAP
jgi:hypothetical protein